MSREPIDLSSFTEAEYEELSGVACVEYPVEFSRRSLYPPSGREFLRLWKDHTDVRITMYRPLEHMPLYINDESMFIRIIALWRLKIAR